ncbi:MAG: IPT/TIG domain-containing protein [Cystobacterineae bacterium]|nr:IPT/TIG domain-containing protein [Cystobacterineae bacterium]
MGAGEKIFSVFCVLVALLLMFASCGPVEVVDVPTLSLSQQNLHFSSEEAGTESFGVNSNTEWSLFCIGCTEWCSITPTYYQGSQTVNVSVTPNASRADRRAIIIVTTGDLNRMLSVMHPGISPSISHFSPTQARSGTLLNITGKNFSPVSSENTVTLGQCEARVESATTQTISVMVPPNTQCTGPVRVKVGEKTGTSSASFTYMPSVNVSTLSSSIGMLNQPYGIAIDMQGNLYVAEELNHRIRKITPEGNITTLAGGAIGHADGMGSHAQFTWPRDLTLGADGNLYVTDSGNHRIRRVTPEGLVSTLAGSEYGHVDGTGSNARFNWPSGITIDTNGMLYVTDLSNHRIRMVTPEGVVSTLAGSGTEGFADGEGVAAQFHMPRGIAVDTEGNLYVVDAGNNRIRKITPEREVSTLAGSAERGFIDGTGSQAQFNEPFGIAIDANGNLYVADSTNHSIRLLTPAGTVITLAGDGYAGSDDGPGAPHPGPPVRFDTPWGIAIDLQGNLYVADSHNHIIRKILLE